MRGFLALTGWMIKRQRRLGAALFVLCLLAWGLAAGAGAALASRDADAPVLTVLLTGESEEAQAEAETLAGLLGRMGKRPEQSPGTGREPVLMETAQILYTQERI